MADSDGETATGSSTSSSEAISASSEAISTNSEPCILNNEAYIANNDEDICISDCSNAGDTKLMSCKLCVKKFHGMCIGIKSKAANPVFTCPECKDAFRALKNVSKDINELKKVSLEVTHIRNTFTSKFRELQTLIENKDDVNAKLIQENAKLQTQVSNLTAELNKVKWSNFRQSYPAKPDLVLSDFTLSQVDEKRLDNTNVITDPNAKVDTLSDELDKSIHPVDKYERIVILVGSNDICDVGDNNLVTDIIPKYTSLLEKAKSKASQVCVSSVCPRTDKPHIKNKIETLNSHLETMCSDNECVFYDNSGIFTLADGSINDGYLVAGNGPHITKSGANKLASSLKLRVKNGITDVTLQNVHQRGKQNSKNDFKHDRPQRNRARQSQQNPPPHRTVHVSQPTNDRGIMFYNDACYFCNEQGHSTDNCGHKGPVVCHKCGDKGHKSKHHNHSYSPRRNYGSNHFDYQH